MRTADIVVAVIVGLSSFSLAPQDRVHSAENEQLGTVSFPISCMAESQRSFERGVALLHSFSAREARKQFETITEQDPRCSMAYWGVAMTYWPQFLNWPETDDMKSARQALLKAGTPVTARERDYIDAIAVFYNPSEKLDFPERATAYSAAMERIYRKYPEDHEAAAFYGLSLLASESESDTAFVNREKAAKVLEKLFAEEPDHPGAAHYLIHIYDKPALAQRGLPAARQYAKIAPASPHALHMPSHIFAREGVWQEDIASNVASIAATGRAMPMHMGGSAHQFHAMDYLVYAYLQCGREGEAAKVIERVRAMPPNEDDVFGGIDWRIYSLAQFPAVYALELRHWSEATALQLILGEPPLAASITQWARAIGAARAGNSAEAHNAAQQASALHKQMVDAGDAYFAQQVADLVAEAVAWANYVDGKAEKSLQVLRSIAEKEEAVGNERPATLIPAREMLADMLLDAGSPQKALPEYELDLKFNPNRFNSLYGAARAAELSGKFEKAKLYYGQLLSVCTESQSARPELARARAAVAKQ